MVEDIRQPQTTRPPNTTITADRDGFTVRQAGDIEHVDSRQEHGAVQNAWRCLQKGTFHALSGKNSNEQRDITPTCRATTWHFAVAGGSGRLTLFSELQNHTDGELPKEINHLKVQATFDHPIHGYVDFESDRSEELHHFDPLLPGFKVFG